MRSEKSIAKIGDKQPWVAMTVVIQKIDVAESIFGYIFTPGSRINVLIAHYQTLW